MFRQYRTRIGRYVMSYRFTQTSTPTIHTMKAEVPKQKAYPRLGGSSKPIEVRVLP